MLARLRRLLWVPAFAGTTEDNGSIYWGTCRFSAVKGVGGQTGAGYCSSGMPVGLVSTSQRWVARFQRVTTAFSTERPRCGSFSKS